MSFENKFKKSLTKQWSMRFETTHPENDNYDGVIIHIKEDFVILAQQNDFEFDGIIILPKKFIKNIRDGKYDKCCNQIMRFNGEIQKLTTPDWLDSCDTIYQILETMKAQDIWGAVEIIFGQEAESAFYIGPITEVNNEQFSLKCYDATGKWEKEYHLSFNEIFKIEINSKYCNNFNAFMRAKSDNQLSNVKK
jgi:hypothetical protein